MKKDIYDSLIPRSVRDLLEVQERLHKYHSAADQIFQFHDPINQNLDFLGLNAETLEKIEILNSITKHADACESASTALESLRIHNELRGALAPISEIDRIFYTANDAASAFSAAAENGAISPEINRQIDYIKADLAMNASIIGQLEKFDEISRYSVLSEKIYPWSEALKIQQALGYPDYIERSLHGITIDRSIFHGFISDSEYERAFDITSALSTDSVFFGEFKNSCEFEEEEENDENPKIILPKEFQERLKAVQFLPVKLFEKISNDPNLMHGMNPIDFEYFIAELMDKSGFENIIVTPRSGDKGRDILATKTVCDVPIIFAFECKKYAPNRKIKPEIMRALLGTVSHPQTKANKGVLVTTSSFTRGAKSFIASESMLSGKDFNDLVKWINQVKK
jgi:HJR/Mrr/RecB family endonuclease